jgi:hypothetical protein
MDDPQLHLGALAGAGDGFRAAVHRSCHARIVVDPFPRFSVFQSAWTRASYQFPGYFGFLRIPKWWIPQSSRVPNCGGVAIGAGPPEGSRMTKEAGQLRTQEVSAVDCTFVGSRSREKEVYGVCIYSFP